MEVSSITVVHWNKEMLHFPSLQKKLEEEEARLVKNENETETQRQKNKKV